MWSSLHRWVPGGYLIELQDTPARFLQAPGFLEESIFGCWDRNVWIIIAPTSMV